jgi:hypothetical protein
MSHADADGHVAGVDDATIFTAAVLTYGALVTTYYLSQPSTQHSLHDASVAAVGAIRSFFSSSQARSGEQGRDAQGKFLPKEPGQQHPGAEDEKKGLDAVGATKNTQPLPNGRIPDGNMPDPQKVEVKSGGSVSNTKQLQEMGKGAVDATGKPLVVVTTNPNVKVSAPAQKNPNLDIKPLKP